MLKSQTELKHFVYMFIKGQIFTTFKSELSIRHPWSLLNTIIENKCVMEKCMYKMSSYNFPGGCSLLHGT